MDMSDTQIRVIMAVLACTLGAILGIGFGIAVWIDGAKLLAAADISVGVVFIAVGVWVVRNPDQIAPHAAIVITSIMFFFFLFVTGGAHSTGIFWNLLIPLFSSFFLGYRKGLSIALGYLFLTVATFLFGAEYLPVLKQVPGHVFVRYIAIYLTVGLVAALYEITRARHEMWLRLQIQENSLVHAELFTLKRAIDQGSLVILVTNTEGTIEYVNARIQQSSGYSREEVVGCNPRMFKSGNTNPEVYTDLWRTISAGGEWRGELENRRKDGSIYWEDTFISPIRGRGGNITNYLAVKEDVTWRKAAGERLSAMYDETKRLNQIMSGREDRVIELKKEVNALSQELSRGIVYPSVEEDT